MKVNRFIYLFVIMMLSCLQFGLYASNYPGKNWKKKDPKKMGLNIEALAKIDSLMKKAEANGVLIYKGALVGQWNYGGDANQMFEVQSITKTVTSTVLGLALTDNLISSVDDKVKDYYPNFDVGPYTKDITFRHLVTASSGIKATLYKENYYDPNNMKPGIESRYHNDHCHQLATVLTYLYCKDLGEVLKDKILTPIQAEDSMKWSYHKNMTLSCENNKKVRVVGGYAFSWWSARDLARLGYLYLNNGKWKNKQLISAEYAKEARTSVPFPVMNMRPDASAKQQSKNTDYGFAWRGRVNNQNKTLWYMSGNGGQFCVVLPEYDLVMTKINSYKLKPYTDISQFESLIWDILNECNPKK